MERDRGDSAVPLLFNQQRKETMRNKIDKLSRRFNKLFNIRPSTRADVPMEQLDTIDVWCRFPRLTCVCPTTYEKLEDYSYLTLESIQEEYARKEAELEEALREEALREGAAIEESTSKQSTSKQSIGKKSLIKQPSFKESKKQTKAGPSTSSDDKTKKVVRKYPFVTIKSEIQEVFLEEKLNAAYVTRLLCILDSHENDVLHYLSLVEEWENLGAERELEDHEFVLPSWNCLKAYRRNNQDTIVKFHCRQNPVTKYDLFLHPLKYLDKHYLYPHALDPTEDVDELIIKNNVLNENWSPTLYSHAYFQDRDHDMKYFLVLKFNSLYAFDDQDAALRFLKATQHLSLKDKARDLQNIEGLHKYDVVVRLQNYHVYKLVKVTAELRYSNTIILRPVRLENPDEKFPESVLSFDTDKERTCWLSAMRLAKYGKQLRANYRAFRSKRPDPAFPGRSVDSMVPSGSEEHMVAMDFTGPVPRIVDDPYEARAIAMNAGYRYKRTKCQYHTRGCCNVSVHIACHLYESWYHGPLEREIAEDLLRDVNSPDRTFLVRESMSPARPGSVISYKHNDKMHHKYVDSTLDPQTRKIVRSIDSGKTRFYDLASLVYFYQLNERPTITFRLLTHVVCKERKSLEAPEEVPKQAPKKEPKKASKKEPKKASKKEPKKASKKVPEQAPMKVPEQAPMEVPEQEAMEVPEQAPAEAPEKVLEKP